MAMPVVVRGVTSAAPSAGDASAAGLRNSEEASAPTTPVGAKRTRRPERERNALELATSSIHSDMSTTVSVAVRVARV